MISAPATTHIDTEHHVHLQDRVRAVAAVLLDAEHEIPGSGAARRLHEVPAQTIPHYVREEKRRRQYEETGGGVERAQKVAVGAGGEEVVDALNEGALEDGPLPAEKRHNH